MNEHRFVSRSSTTEPKPPPSSCSQKMTICCTSAAPRENRFTKPLSGNCFMTNKILSHLKKTDSGKMFATYELSHTDQPPRVCRHRHSGHCRCSSLCSEVVG